VRLCVFSFLKTTTLLQGWEPNPLVLLRAHKKGAGSGGAVGERCQLGCTLDDADLVWEKLGNPTVKIK
jgi:hypothetical protein